jgi:hypothetical protein
MSIKNPQTSQKESQHDVNKKSNEHQTTEIRYAQFNFLGENEAAEIVNGFLLCQVPYVSKHEWQ